MNVSTTPQQVDPKHSGILIATEIEAEIKAGRLVARANFDRIQGCSYDMCVGTIFSDGQIFENGTKKQLSVKPGGIISIFTDEELMLPDDVCATAFAMNQQSSRGLLVLNPGHVDPGFKGPLTVKALNLRSTSIVIQQGEPVFTVVFERLSGTTKAFGSNKPRPDREREFNSKTVETTPAGISEIVLLNPSGPYPTRHETQDLIRSHWLSRWSLYGGIAAIILATWAAVAGSISVYLQFNDAKPKAATQEVASTNSALGILTTNDQQNPPSPVKRNQADPTLGSGSQQAPPKKPQP
jgi:deoxycytidine triphosphate deaminase